MPVRSGGFGGAAGLADYLQHEHVDVLIDATHPYAGGISANAWAAAQMSGVRFVAVHRPPWIAVAGDRWTEVENVRDAVRALGRRRAASWSRWAVTRSRLWWKRRSTFI